MTFHKYTWGGMDAIPGLEKCARKDADYVDAETVEEVLILIEGITKLPIGKDCAAFLRVIYHKLTNGEPK